MEHLYPVSYSHAQLSACLPLVACRKRASPSSWMLALSSSPFIPNDILLKEFLDSLMVYISKYGGRGLLNEVSLIDELGGAQFPSVSCQLNMDSGFPVCKMG